MTDDAAKKDVLPGLDRLMEAWAGALQPSETAAKLLDPRHWLGVGGAALEQPFETVLGLPRLADVPDLDRKLLHLMRAWSSVAQRGVEYGTVVSQVWLGAFGDFLVALQAAAAEGKPIGSTRELLEKWTATVNERLLVAQRSDGFLEAQRRLLDALLTSRGAEQELVEIGAKAADLPTRAEMDDVHRSLHTLKRQVRALERRLEAAMAAPPAAAEPKPAPAGPKRSPAKRPPARAKRERAST